MARLMVLILWMYKHTSGANSPGGAVLLLGDMLSAVLPLGLTACGPALAGAGSAPARGAPAAAAAGPLAPARRVLSPS